MFNRVILVCAVWFALISPALSADINILPNAGFESKPISWSSLDACDFEIYSRMAHSGNSSLAFYPHSEGAGIQCDLSEQIHPGFRYSFSGYFRTVQAGWGQADVWLRYLEKGFTRQIVIGRADTNDKDWTELSSEFFLPEAAEETDLVLVIKSAWGQIAFLVDDLQMRPALQIQQQPSINQQQPAIIFRLGKEDPVRKKIIAAAELYDSQNRFISQIEQYLDTPAVPTLDPGFYQVRAQVKDLDGKPFSAEKIIHSGEMSQLLEEIDQRAASILASSHYASYFGWIRYQQFLLSSSQQRNGTISETTLQAAWRLDGWTRKIQTHPDIIKDLTGVIEWAYPSAVDDSGQPFKLAIPTSYTADRAYPLVVVMHGYGGNHMEYSAGVQSNADYFELHVLGRARGGGYTDLSETDVLDAVNYVQKHWQIDDRRIHLTGSSMGGGGTFKLATRYPDRWASGRPVCGYAEDLPVENMLNVPIYSTHSQDDPTVPVLTSRAPLLKLAEGGGQVIIDETNGLQHAAWTYTEGNLRGQKWMEHQVRPQFCQVHHIDFTAVNRKASGAYWLQIAKWGDCPGPAHFQATAGINNQLFVQLDNIHSLKIDIPSSPFKAEMALQISINHGVPITMSAPLPDSLFINEDAGRWSVDRNLLNRPLMALHTSGGVHNLYQGEPLLIVWGTDGNVEQQKQLQQAAQAAAKSVNPMWVSDEGEGHDGIPNHQLLYGHLRAKADTAVSDLEIENHNLILIGSAEENKIVRKMEQLLPVQIKNNNIICSDGVQFPQEGAILGLYYYNPLAPQRLVYWIAADQASAYRPWNNLLQLQNNSPCGIDLLIIHDEPTKLVATRHFDSCWKWSSAFSDSKKMSEQDITAAAIESNIAAAMRSITGSDLALYGIGVPPQYDLCIPNVTRWSDIAALNFTTPIAVLHLHGEQIDHYYRAFKQKQSSLRFYPTPDSLRLDPDKKYQIAISGDYSTIQQIINLDQQVPDDFRITEYSLFAAMQRVLFH